MRCGVTVTLVTYYPTTVFCGVAAGKDYTPSLLAPPTYFVLLLLLLLLFLLFLFLSLFLFLLHNPFYLYPTECAEFGSVGIKQFKRGAKTVETADENFDKLKKDVQNTLKTLEGIRTDLSRR